MKNIQLMDCTLRDGGYVNNWHFGRPTIQDILLHLVSAGIDNIECGYLNYENGMNGDYTLFTELSELKKILPPKSENQNFAVMINYGDYPIEKIPNMTLDIIIRVAFHKEDSLSALDYCASLIKKGYRVFVQPMGTADYEDSELIDLIKRTNQIKPDAFYIVDSFGVMELKDFRHHLFLADHALSREIMLGYHSHNNLQQAYGNSKYMVSQNLKRQLILDTSVYGMGRGAGNLNTELFVKYMNETFDTNYMITPLLEIIDYYLNSIFMEKFWGYSLPFYLSAINHCHPNYAGYFTQKNTLTVKAISELICSIPTERRIHYSDTYAEQLYEDYQRHFIDDTTAIDELASVFTNHHILVLAPGASLNTHRTEIEKWIEEYSPICISCNIDTGLYKSDYVFCTNLKRFEELSTSAKIIVTSNIKYTGRAQYVINYSSYINNEPMVKDNVTIMLLQLLYRCQVKEVYLAGFDGYSLDVSQNYYRHNIGYGDKMENKIKKNEIIRKIVDTMQGKMKLHFLTPSLYL